MQHPTMRAATPPPMPFIELQTLRVHYEQAGSGRNVLVLVHGNFASTRWWKPVLDSLPRDGARTRSICAGAAGRSLRRAAPQEGRISELLSPRPPPAPSRPA